MTAVREKIKNEFGERYLPAKPIRYAAGKMAQEAHEAIRPTDLSTSPRTRSRATSRTTSSGCTSSSTPGSSPARWPRPSSW